MIASRFTFGQVVIIRYFAHSSCADLSIGTLWSIYKDKVMANTQTHTDRREWNCSNKDRGVKEIFSDYRLLQVTLGITCWSAKWLPAQSCLRIHLNSVIWHFLDPRLNKKSFWRACLQTAPKHLLRLQGARMDLWGADLSRQNIIRDRYQIKLKCISARFYIMLFGSSYS